MNCNLREDLISLMEILSYYREFLECTRKKIQIGEFTSIEIKYANFGELNALEPMLDVSFGDFAHYIVLFKRYDNKSNIFMQDRFFSRNIYIYSYLFNNSISIENEIFICKDSVKDMIKIAQDYDKIIHYNAVEV